MKTCCLLSCFMARSFVVGTPHAGSVGDTTSSATRLKFDMSSSTSSSKFKAALHAELGQAFGSDISSGAQQRVDQLKDALRPMFVAMQKNQYGKIDLAAVRYVLRRLFMQQKGWSIVGLEPMTNDAERSNDAGAALIEDLFTRHISKLGSSLHEVSVLAAMAEHLITEDMTGKLRLAYYAKQLQPENSLSMAQAEEVIALHMAAFVRARDVSKFTAENVKRFERLIYTTYPNWESTRKRMLAILERVQLETLSFDDVAGVVAEISSEFAHWQNDECKKTKSSLVELEHHHDSGRVRLLDFYNAALNQGKYQFTETISYLRHIGTLDESDEMVPKVIIPNYVTGRSNCVARARYYSVCCIDECEDIFGALEQQLGKPSATVAEITQAINRLAEGRLGLNEITEAVHRRLLDIATHHAGLIPLHGRLFSQWMHAAFPRECVYPHRTGTVSNMEMEQWEKETGERTAATKDELKKWVAMLGESSSKHDGSAVQDEDSFSGMWTMEEELITVSRTYESAAAEVSVSDMNSVNFSALKLLPFLEEQPFARCIALLAMSLAVILFKICAFGGKKGAKSMDAPDIAPAAADASPPDVPTSSMMEEHRGASAELRSRLESRFDVVEKPGSTFTKLPNGALVASMSNDDVQADLAADDWYNSA